MDVVLEPEDRRKGCFYGCAVGDALGLPLEFQERDTHPLVTEMIPATQWKDLAAGSWSDDTSLMLCLAASLVATRGVQDNHNQLSHYNAWWEEGYLSVTGYCFDIGRTTTLALAAFEKHGRTVAKTTMENHQGNGSLMRIAPIPILFHALNTAAIIEAAARSSETTHAHPVCKNACSIFSVLCAHAIRGENKDKLLEILNSLQSIYEFDTSLWPILRGEFMRKARHEIRSGGYVVDSLEAALWAFFKTDGFEEGAILAVNLAHDADTVGAIYGMLAGAAYGYSDIPARWLAALQGRRMLDGVYDDLARLVVGFGAK
jgi:ADP-ribosyl-[dinitrogen reductase] hydrolase